MLTCIVVDDEPKSRESLQILVEDFCHDVKVVALCSNVSEAIKAIEDHKPQIVFLDIQMQGETGFDLLEKVKKIDFEVIFTTAYSEYAIKAFKFSAIDYLLKPIDLTELKKAVEKVEKKIGGSFSERLEHFIQNWKNGVHNRFKLALPTNDGLLFISADEILYCEASSNYTYIFLNDGKKYIVSRTLKEYEELLTEHGFFRIHNAHLINLNAVKKYVRGDGGYVIMANDATLTVSKRKKESFLSHIGSKKL